MPKLLSRYATPLITGLFVVSLISGIALFFHVGPSGFHGMHEWLSMVLILPFGLHLWRNWRPFLNYMRRAPMAIALVLSLIAAAAFLYPSSDSASGRGRPPQFAFAHQVLQGSATELAALLGMTVAALMAELEASGFAVDNADQTLADIAAKAGKSETELVAALVKAAD